MDQQLCCNWGFSWSHKEFWSQDKSSELPKLSQECSSYVFTSASHWLCPIFWEEESFQIPAAKGIFQWGTQLWAVSSDIPRSGGTGVRKNGNLGWQQRYPLQSTFCAPKIYFFILLCSHSPSTRASRQTTDLVLQVECLLQVARSCSKIPRVTLWYLLGCAINLTWCLFQMQKPLIQKGLPTWMVKWQDCLCHSLDLLQSPL